MVTTRVGFGDGVVSGSGRSNDVKTPCFKDLFDSEVKEADQKLLLDLFI